jgi:aminoglycoside phosphotransferase family enzyme/predicted kinase
MRASGFYEHQPERVDVTETHISTIFIAGDRVYKVKKELTLPFLDYASLERRRHFCHEELRLNRRLAPDLYRGVRAIVPRGDGFALADPDDPAAVEFAVEMRRLPADRALDRLIEAGAATPEMVRRVAQRIALFHEEAPPAPTGYGGPDDAKARMDENLSTVLPWVGTIFDRHTYAAVERFFNAFVLTNRELLKDRLARGRVREGHGDLRAEHVLLENSGVTVYDCVEFDERLRFADVVSDLAFLYMDLERLGAGALASELGRAYVEYSRDGDVLRLLPFFACYRAWVRMKLACLQLAQFGKDERRRSMLLSEIRSLSALSLRLIWRARLPVVLVFCGVGASGKSALAEEIARRSGFHCLSSDVIRKGSAGVPVNERAPRSVYDESSTIQTYDDLLVEALELADAARGVVIDATFGKRERRRALADSVRGSGSRVLFCECRAPEAVLRERAVVREREPERGSDATWDVIKLQIESFEPLDEVPARDHLAVRTDRPIEETLDEVEAFVSVAIEGSA